MAKPDKPDQSCKSCEHWGPVNSGISGFCRKENPRSATKADAGKEPVVSFPLTLSHEWCDSWLKRTPASPTTRPVPA